MDFKLVLESLLTGFQEKDIRYALTGGFALGLWGGSRSTVDLDFLIHREDMDKVHMLMTNLGYEIHHHTENVSQYVSPLARFGGIDFIHAFRDASVEMLKRAVEKEIFSGNMKVRTMIPEDIIGLERAEELRDDMEKLKSSGQPPFIRNGKIDMDLYVDFLSQFNEFINHQPKPFRPMIEKDMRL